MPRKRPLARQQSTDDEMEMGNNSLNHSFRMGRVSKTPASSDSERDSKQGPGRKSSWEKFMAMKAASKAEKAEKAEKADTGTNSLMEMFMMMQQERVAEERRREEREAERQGKRDVQFMTLMAALLNPAAAAGAASAAAAAALNTGTHD